jgi:hypothetical protein
MPRYFFNVRNGHHYMPDLEGEEFADAAGAHQRAWWTAKAVLSRPSPYSAGWKNAVFEVTDEQGRFVFSDVRGTRRSRCPLSSGCLRCRSSWASLKRIERFDGLTAKKRAPRRRSRSSRPVHKGDAGDLDRAGMGVKRGAGGLVSAWLHPSCRVGPLPKALTEFGISPDDQFALKLVGQIISLGDLRRHAGETINLFLHAAARERGHHDCPLNDWVEGREIEPPLAELGSQGFPNGLLLTGTLEPLEHRSLTETRA